MKILGIEHIGIALKHRKTTSNFLNEILGLDSSRVENVPDQKVLTEIFDTGNGKLELLEATDESSPISHFLEKNGNAMHHIALEVDNLVKALNVLKEKNIQLIDHEPRSGAENYKIAFIHPKATGGILIELCQKT